MSARATAPARRCPTPPVDARLTNVVPFSDALAQGAQLAFTPVALCGDDLLFLQYTGGTTGLSKGAALSHRNLVANTEQFKAFMADAMRPGQDVVVTALPLYHIFALMVNFISYFSIGAENWLVANARDLDSFVEILRQARCTALTGVNTLYGGLVMHPKIVDVDFSRLRVAIGGGAAVLPTTSAKWKALTGKDILEGYGLSETSPILTLNPATTEASRRRWACLSRPPTSSCSMPTTRKRRSASRAKCAPKARRSCRATGKSRRPMPTPSPPTAISAPATSACSTPRVSSRSSIARRT